MHAPLAELLRQVKDVVSCPLKVLVDVHLVLNIHRPTDLRATLAGRKRPVSVLPLITLGFQFVLNDGKDCVVL